MMNRLNLEGNWTLREAGGKISVPGHLPGSNYLDLMAAGVIADPFWGNNETGASGVAKQDYEYFRSFDLPQEFLEREHLDLVVSGLDTLAEIRVNNTKAAEVNNCFRTWRISLQGLVRGKDNRLSILFKAPFEYIRARQAANPMVSAGMGVKGVAHIRKVQCHFGWDWGPNLPPAGVFGEIALEAWDQRIAAMEVLQRHQNGAVHLSVSARILGDATIGGSSGLRARCVLTTPGGGRQEYSPAAGSPFPGFSFEIPLENPRLWWPNGLGEQNLYKAVVELAAPDGTVIDTCEKTIGLRTLELDRSPGHGGELFRFVVNGAPVFARGADWIPSDSFVTRTTAEDLRFYIESAKFANMNMLRVWGGGHYESDAFYELCDKNGIMVWQDFCFACSSYPFDEAEFVENVHQEVIDNVGRLRHHPSLVLWSGNNENEVFGRLWKRNKGLYSSNTRFYYRTLPSWLEELDTERPYWPGSPSSGAEDRKPNDLRYGDSHLWQVWHGLQPIEAFRKMPTRFCSEFGLESFPSMRAVRSYTNQAEPKISDPVMMIHQKSAGGNQKILFYLLAQYRAPAKFKDMVYLSQLVQSAAMRFATDQWRRNMDQCGGALYWQYNDCWPVASWAGIDYRKQYKALHYHARHFNKPLCLSNDYFKDRAEIYLANDLPRNFKGSVAWSFRDFKGARIAGGNEQLDLPGVSARKILSLDYAGLLGGRDIREAALTVEVQDRAGAPVDTKRWLLVPDKFARLPRPVLQASCEIRRWQAAITLKANAYARYVYAEIDGLEAPLSDNFFDINGGEEYTVTVPLIGEAAGLSGEDILQRLRLRSLAEVEPRNHLAVDYIRRFLMRFLPINFITWLAFKFM
ncbi:MAG: hypothetical protein LBT11_05880 [Treponema sp.]|jgi:beta-mannosidase|nr:hypothetical protein [Treponema sp.]